jgi:hypothetical protein
MSNSTVFLQHEGSVNRKMQDEEAFALKQAQEYTWKFFENKASPEKQKNLSPLKEAFKGQDYRLEQEK